MEKRHTLIKANIVVLCLMALFYGVLLLGEYITSVFILLGAALIVTYLLLGPVQLAQKALTRLFSRFFPPARQRNCHIWAVSLVYLLFLLLFALGVLRLTPPLSRQVQDFATELPAYLNRLESQVEGFSRQSGLQGNFLSNILQSTLKREEFSAQSTRRSVQEASAPTPAESQKTPASQPEGLAQRLNNLLTQSASQALAYLVNIGATTLAGIVYALTVILLVFYLLLDGEILKNGFIGLLPQGAKRRTGEFMGIFHTVFHHFIKSQVILSALAGVYLYCAYSLIGMKYAFLLSFVFGVASILPVIGPWIGLLPGILLTLFSGHPQSAVTLLILMGIFYIVKVYFLVPRLLKPSLEIHPVIIILSFLACLKFASVLGVLISFPVASLICVWTLYRQKKAQAAA